MKSNVYHITVVELCFLIANLLYGLISLQFLNGKHTSCKEFIVPVSVFFPFAIFLLAYSHLSIMNPQLQLLEVISWASINSAVQCSNGSEQEQEVSTEQCHRAVPASTTELYPASVCKVEQHPLRKGHNYLYQHVSNRLLSKSTTLTAHWQHFRMDRSVFQKLPNNIYISSAIIKCRRPPTHNK